uniref:Hemolysin XhlA n=1 Tax=Myoviridae sp. ctxZR60 TaxID=2826712 RepID=A0A8S5MW91_9CAUD|nr:MAG TPA: hemolysin XhlA [Myoviridae sp. ctxZR60]
MNEVEMEHRLTAVEKLAGSNKHRIDEVEENNKALQDISKSVAVMAEQMKTMNSKVDSMDTAVKQLQAVPAKRWDALIAVILSALATGIVGIVLGKIL